MTQDWTVPGWVVAAMLAALVLLTALLVLVTIRSRAAVRRVDAELSELRAELRPAPPSVGPAPREVDEREYVITRLGDNAEPVAAGPAAVVPGPLFADLVLRESVVRAGSLAAGLRRALAPEARNRIRFEMRREVKRARKQRRADLKQARFEWQDRQRRADPGASAA